MTPMSKVQNQFKDFKQILETKGLLEVILNKAEPKDKSGYAEFCGEDLFYTKEVKSDFIKLYQSRNIDKSIGIAFSYIDMPEENWFVKVSLKTSIKKDSNFLESRSLSLIEFKDIFNKVVENLKENNLDTKEIIALIQDSFDLESINNRKKIKRKM